MSDPGTLPSDAGARAGGAVPTSGLCIGRYRLVEQLGAGGMGAVWEAEQEEPRRTVALKLLSRGEDPQALARFRYEAEILAQLSHPGIAQVYESGVARESSEAGAREQPWFAMEHVPGARNLLEYAQAEQLDLRQRLRLFLGVADAVHYGHQKGVIHRDLKPANLLVDAAGHPKVIDFGIARLTEGELSERSLMTSTGQVLGTLRYMSPEQISGRRASVDVQSDVFSLGLVLFELLAERPAYELDRLSLTEAVEAVSNARLSPLRAVRPGLPVELEWIVQRATAPERERRYPSVFALAADIERFQSGDRVEAAPPSATYKLRVFVRRHRLAVGAAAVVLASLAISLVVLARSLSIERKSLAAVGRSLESERRSLDSERAQRIRAEGNARFLSDMLRSASPTDLGAQVLLVDVLDRAAPRIAREYADQPLLRADLHSAIGEVYRNLSRPVEAVEHARAAYELRSAGLEEDDPALLAARSQLGAALREKGEYAQAERPLRDALAQHDRLLGREHPSSMRSRALLVDLLTDTGQLDEARALLLESLGGEDPASMPLDEARLVLIDRLLRLYVRAANYEALGPWMDGLSARQEQLPEATAEFLGTILENRGLQLVSEGRLDEAQAHLRQALARALPRYGAKSRHVIALRVNLANVALLRDDGAAALAWLEEALSAAEDAYGWSHPHTFEVRYAQAGALWVAGEKERALQDLATLVEECERSADEDPLITAERAGSLGRMHVWLGRPAEGVPILAKAAGALGRGRGDAHPTTQHVLRWWVRALEESGRAAEAEALRPRLVPQGS